MSCLSAAQVIAAPSLLAKIASVESANQPAAIGDGGRARGLYQMHLGAVLDCGGTRQDWLTLTNPATASRFAGMYVRKLSAQLPPNHRTDADIYAAWNLGVAGYARRSYKIGACPTITRRTVAKVK